MKRGGVEMKREGPSANLSSPQSYLTETGKKIQEIVLNIQQCACERCSVHVAHA